MGSNNVSIVPQAQLNYPFQSQIQRCKTLSERNKVSLSNVPLDWYSSNIPLYWYSSNISIYLCLSNISLYWYSSNIFSDPYFPNNLSRDKYFQPICRYSNSFGHPQELFKWQCGTAQDSTLSDLLYPCVAVKGLLNPLPVKMWDGWDCLKHLLSAVEEGVVAALAPKLCHLVGIMFRNLFGECF